MSVIINPIITNAGLNVFTPMATGIEFTFTHVAVGTGTSAVNANATALENEIDRFTIAGGGVIAGGKAVSINALVTNHSNANPQDYNISEIGFYGLDGNNNTVLFAIHRQNTTIVRKVAGADIALPFVLGLSALPTENMTVTIDTNTSGALALLGQHVANAHPHTQYKRTLDNTEQLKIANGTDNDHAVSKGQLDGAISTEATTRANADTNLQNTKANLGGSNTQRFKIADATASDEAVSLSQMNSAISGGIGGIPPVDLSGKADKNGNANEKFKVANATASDEAVSKGQLDAKTGIATDTIAGIVEKATQAEMNVGAANVWPDAATIFNGFDNSQADAMDLPLFLGNYGIRWGSAVQTSVGENTISITYSKPFPTDTLYADAILYNPSATSSGEMDVFAQLVSSNRFGAAFYIQSTVALGVLKEIRWFAIGR